MIDKGDSGASQEFQPNWQSIAEQLAEAIVSYQNATPRWDWFGELDHALEHYRRMANDS